MNASRPEPRIVVVFRNDDLSSLSDVDHERRIFDLFDEHGVPQTLGVIPCISRSYVCLREEEGECPLPENQPVCEFLQECVRRSHSEVALHGYTHRTNRYSLPDRREWFEFKKLPLTEQEEMLRKGLAILEQGLGLRPMTFIPPWNRLDRNTVAACVQAGLHIVSAGPFVPISDGLAAFGTNSGLASFEQDWAKAKGSSYRVFVNILFHSQNLWRREDQQMLKHVINTVSRDPEAATMTVSEAVMRFPKELESVNEAGRNIVPFHAVERSARSRLWLYCSLAPALHEKTRPAALGEAALQLYWQADYVACAALTAMIDRQSWRHLWVARGVFILAGGLIAILAWSILSRVLPTSAPGWLWPTSLFPLLGAILVAQRLTATDSRREALLVGLLMAGSCLAVSSLLTF